MDFPKEHFLKIWPKQYVEGWEADYFGKGNHHLTTLASILDEHAKGKVALDIGCGSGYWTGELLVPRFEKVIAVDLVEKPESLPDKVKYIELQSNDYSLPGIADNSVDFVWSFGVFCYLSNNATAEYLKNIRRVLTTGGTGIIMFPEWNKGKGSRAWLKNVPDTEKYKNNEHCQGWFYYTLAVIKELTEAAGLVFVGEVWPPARDTLVKFRKD